MNTREGGQTRFEQAQQQAVRLLRSLNRTGSGWFSFAGAEARTRVMLIAFADRAMILSPFTTNTADLVGLVERLKPTDGQTRLAEALQLAETYLLPTRGGVEQAPISPEAGSKLVLVSDGNIGDVAELVLRSGDIELIRVGETHDNVGIVSLRAERNYERPELLELFAEMRNFGDEAVRTDVSLYVDDVLRDVRPEPLTLGPAVRALAPTSAPGVAGAALGGAAGGGPPSATSLSFSLAVDKAAVVEVRLSREDALAADNRAFVVAPPPRKLHVLLVTEGNYFLQSVLRGLPLEAVEQCTPAEYESRPAEQIEKDGRSRYDVVIFDKHSTKRLPAGGSWFIGAAPLIAGVQTGKLENPSYAFMSWNETDPILRHVALEYVYVSDETNVAGPAGATKLAEGPHGPVILRFSSEGRNYLLMSFALEKSNLWSKPAFPVLAYNALRFLGGGGVAAEQEITRPGGTLRFPLPPGATEAAIKRPDGVEANVSADASGWVRFAATEQVGVYSVVPGVEGFDRAAVNLDDAVESDIAPRESLTLGGKAVAVGQQIRLSTPEIWRWFVGAALLILFVEWYIYNRRVMI
jgi:hypothetical protein